MSQIVDPTVVPLRDPTVLERADAQGLMHQFVEHDRPGDAIESVRKSFNALREIIG